MMRDEQADRIEALVSAAEAGAIGKVTELIEQGVPVDALNHEHRSALDHAVWANNVVLVACLLELGADPEQAMGPCHETYPLDYAAPRDLVEVAALVIRAGGRVNGEPRPDRMGLPLSLAMGHASTDMVALLLDNGVDANGVAQWRRRPLSEAIAGRRPSMIRLLLEHGAHPKPYDLAEVTSLMNEAGLDEQRRKDYAEVIELIKEGLQARGPSHDVPDEAGSQPRT